MQADTEHPAEIASTSNSDDLHVPLVAVPPLFSSELDEEVHISSVGAESTSDVAEDDETSYSDLLRAREEVEGAAINEAIRGGDRACTRYWGQCRGYD